MNVQAHLSELNSKHQALEEKLEEALLHPSVDDLEINDLKRQKLMIKDEIAKLEAAEDTAA
ncbi:MAG: YdcH family protein [Hyphomicrobiales bacterium]